MARKPANYPYPTASAERVAVDADVIAGFMETFIQPNLKKAKPIAAFHYELWEWDCSDAPLGVAAAPRGHAKTTAVTIVGALVDVLFGVEDFEIIIGANEKKASQFLDNINYILTDPDFIELQNEFEVEVLNYSQSHNPELVGRVKGREFCIMARGKGQKVRGELWRQQRPGKIRVDDLENDEDIKNPDTRLSDQRWFENAVIPALADDGKIRMVGTILHADSLISKYLDDSQLNIKLADEGIEPQWYGKRYSAHKSFNDFSEILWPEKFDEKKLRSIRQRYISQKNKDGYSQEYLSVAIAEGNEFFAKEGFQEMEAVHFRRNLTVYGAIDFAVSEKKGTDNTAFGIGGVDFENYLNIIDVRRELIDTYKACELWFELDTLYRPEYWIVEDENIRKSVGPFLEIMMREKNHFLNMKLVTPKQDKTMRARSFQARHNTRGVRYNKQMPGGYEEFEEEMLQFPRGKHDDGVDVMSMLGMDLAEMVPANTEAEDEEEDYAEMVASTGEVGRSETTGY